MVRSTRAARSCCGLELRKNVGRALLADPRRSPAIPRERSNGVAVGANEIALRELAQHLRTAVTAEVAEIPKLLRAGAVVPLHDGRREHPTTVGARAVDLETCQPCTEPVVGALRLPVDAAADSLLVTDVVDLSATRLADGLHAVASQRSLVKLRKRLRCATSWAALHT